MNYKCFNTTTANALGAHAHVWVWHHIWTTGQRRREHTYSGHHSQDQLSHLSHRNSPSRWLYILSNSRISSGTGDLAVEAIQSRPLWGVYHVLPSCLQIKQCHTLIFYFTHSLQARVNFCCNWMNSLIRETDLSVSSYFLFFLWQSCVQCSLVCLALQGN